MNICLCTWGRYIITITISVLLFLETQHIGTLSGCRTEYPVALFARNNASWCYIPSEVKSLVRVYTQSIYLASVCPLSSKTPSIYTFTLNQARVIFLSVLIHFRVPQSFPNFAHMKSFAAGHGMSRFGEINKRSSVSIRPFISPIAKMAMIASGVKRGRLDHPTMPP